jgi:group I intron endonuclease
MVPKHQSIYKIENLLNGMVYIGQTGDFSKRMSSHRRIRNKKMYIDCAINKYGDPNFSFEELCKVPEHLADYMEKFFQECYNSYAPNGYNVLIGGKVLKKHSEESIKKMSINSSARRPEVREKISKANKGKLSGEKHPLFGKRGEKSHLWGKPSGMLGKHHTVETKYKISIAKKGVKLSEETKRRMSERQIGEKNHFYGKHFSQEHRNKISIRIKEWWDNRKGKQCALAI